MPTESEWTLVNIRIAQSGSREIDLGLKNGSTLIERIWLV